jgi:hypothetical protein
MTAERHIRGRTRRAAASLLALALLAAGAAACAQEGDNDIAIEEIDGDGGQTDGGTGGGTGAFAATAEFLKETATRSADESHRIEARIGLGEVADGAPPAMTGEIDGANSHLRMDLGVIFEEVSAGMGLGDIGDVFGDTDMTMETLTDGETMYIRAPFFAALGDMMPTGTSTPGASELAALGDGWGSVSMSELGEVLPEDVAASIAGQQSFNPRAAVEMMENSEGVEDLGTQEIDGVTQHGLRAQVTFADLVRTSGSDPETFAQAAGAGSSEEVVEELLQTRMPIEVWIDEAGYLRTLSYTLSMGEFVDAVGGGDLGLSETDFVYAISFSDYGGDFTFEFPAEATDITSAFAEIYSG